MTYLYQDSPRWRPADYLEAHSQVLEVLATGRRPAEFHPLASSLVSDGRAPRLIDLARTFVEGLQGSGARSLTDREILASGGPGSDHLGDLLGGLANRLILDRQPALLAPVAAICRPVELTNFAPASVGVVELAAPIAPASPINRPWQTLMPSGRAEQMALRSSPVRLRFSEIIITNDDVNAIQGTIDAAGTGAAQNELTALFSLMNSPVTLADGQPAFDAAYSNATTGAGKNAAALDGATALLRAQQVNGKAADCAPRFLVVPGADEVTAHSVVRSAFGESGKVDVLATAYLENYWFLVADPATWPLFVRATLRGAGGQSLRLSPGRPNERESVRDLILEGLHSFDYGISGRVGAVRIGF